MTQLFHADIGIPLDYQTVLPYPRLRYGAHAIEAARADGLKTLPRVLPEKLEVIEVESTDGKPTKWTIRTSLKADPSWDLVLVIQADGFVRTVWLNHRLDRHETLNTSRYTQPPKLTASTVPAVHKAS